MKKTFLLISMLIISSMMMAQNMVTNPSFENWTNGSPDGWFGSKSNISTSGVVQYTTNPHTGASACQLVNETSTHKRFTTGSIALEAGQDYDITFWVRGAGEIRTGLYDATTGDYGYTDYNEYIAVNSTEWTQYTQTVVSGGTVSNGEFIFSVRNTVAGNDDLQIDDVEITGGVVILTANFSASQTVATPGTTIQFNDLSTGGPTSWSWEITGPETMTSTNQNPSFSFNTAGMYSVSLTVTNEQETSTLLAEEYITIANFLVNQDWNDLQWKGWSQVSVVGELIWNITETYGVDNTPCVRMSGYSGGAADNEDWLISPEFNLSTNENVVLNFYSAFNYEGNALEVYFSNDYDGDPESATWQALQCTWSQGSWSWTSSGNVNLNDFSGDHCYIGFKYTCTSADAATWELDNILITTTSVGIHETEAVNFQLSPNPCNGQFNITTDEKAQVSVYTILGQMIHQQTIDGNSTIQLGNVASGIYIVKIQNEKGETGSRKMVIR